MTNPYTIPKGYSVSGSIQGIVNITHEPRNELLHVRTSPNEVCYIKAWEADVHIDHDNEAILVV